MLAIVKSNSNNHGDEEFINEQQDGEDKDKNKKKSNVLAAQLSLFN